MTDRRDDAPFDEAPEPTAAAEFEPTSETTPDVADNDGDEDFDGDDAADADAAEGDEELEEGFEDDAGVAPAPRLGARAQAEAARRRAAERSGTRREDRAVPGRATQRTQFPIDPALRVKDPVSTIFVAGSIIVFALVFLQAMAFGGGGAFRAKPTPVPTPIVTQAPSTSPGVSGSPATSGSPVVTPAPTVAPSAAPSASPAAS